MALALALSSLPFIVRVFLFLLFLSVCATVAILVLLSSPPHRSLSFVARLGSRLKTEVVAVVVVGAVASAVDGTDHTDHGRHSHASSFHPFALSVCLSVVTVC